MPSGVDDTPLLIQTPSVLHRHKPSRGIPLTVDVILVVQGQVHGVPEALAGLSARNIASLRPDWEYHEFAGAGHVPMLEVPGEFVEVVADWLTRQGAAATDPLATAAAGASA